MLTFRYNIIGGSINTLDREEKIQNIIKYGKYVVLVVIIGIIALIIINSKQTYGKIEENLIAAAQKYVADNNINVNKSHTFEFNGYNVTITLSCVKSLNDTIANMGINTNGTLSTGINLAITDSRDTRQFSIYSAKILFEMTSKTSSVNSVLLSMVNSSDEKVFSFFNIVRATFLVIITTKFLVWGLEISPTFPKFFAIRKKAS